MAISMRCPKCGKNYQLLDEQAGLRVRCKQCQSVFEVQSPPERLEIVPELPGKRGPRLAEIEDDEPESRPVVRKRSNNRTVKWVVGLVGGAMMLIVLVCAGGGWLVWSGMQWFMKRGSPIVVIDQAPPQQERPPKKADAPPPKEAEMPWPKLPTLTIKNLDHAIELLRSGNNFTRLRALEYIQKQPVPPDAAKRKAVLDAVEPLTNDDDPLIKIAANLVKINWGGIE